MGDPAIIEHHPECSEGKVTLGQSGVLSNVKWRCMKEEFQTAKADNNNNNNKNKTSNTNNDRDNNSNNN